MADKTLYALLGVSPSATADELKKAYKKLARENHPDVNPGNAEAEERFKRISHAFAVLSDPEKRAMYDELGDEAEKIGYDAEKLAAFRQWKASAKRGGRRRPSARGSPPFEVGGKGGLGVDLEDLLGDLFSGGGAGFGPRTRAGFGGLDVDGARRGSDVSAELIVSFEDAARGAERELALTKPMRCSACNGSGSSVAGGSTRCRSCGGSGRTQISQGAVQVSSVCTSCGGSGQSPAAKCRACSGAGARNEQVRLKVKIPRGVESGQQIRLRGQGAPGEFGGPDGDLLLEVNVEKHPYFRRDKLDLHLEVPLTISEATFGAEIELPTLDGRVKLKVPAGAQSGSKLRLRGRGLEAKGEKGDLYATLLVKLPEVKPEGEAAQAVARLEALYTRPVRTW